MSLQLRFWRNDLLPKVDAVFGLSATLLMTDPRWDLCESIKSIATLEHRSSWLDADGERDKYTDTALKTLYTNWSKVEVTQKQTLLIPIFIRRNECTIVDGKPAMEKYRDRLVMVPASLKLRDVDRTGERSDRENMLDGLKKITQTQRMVLARWLAWTPWLCTRDWQKTGRHSKDWWDGFTLTDTKTYARGRKLVGVLKEIKKEGGKPIIFASYVFLLQFAAKVCHLSGISDM